MNLKVAIIFEEFWSHLKAFSSIEISFVYTTPSSLREQCLGESDPISLEDLDYDNDFANMIKLPSGIGNKYHCFSDSTIKTLFMSHTDRTQRPRNPLTRKEILRGLIDEIENKLLQKYPNYRTFRQRRLSCKKKNDHNWLG